MDSNFFRSRRDELKLTQREIARRLDMTTAAVSAWECGENIPRLALLADLAKAYEVSESRILKEISEMSRAAAK